jgi:hypothetical protein
MPGVNFGMRRKRGINFTEADSRQLEKIRKIAKIAAQIFSSKGFLATSLDDIAAGAKLTKGGVYHYFNSNAEILFDHRKTSSTNTLNGCMRRSDDKPLKTML